MSSGRNTHDGNSGISGMDSGDVAGEGVGAGSAGLVGEEVGVESGEGVGEVDGGLIFVMSTEVIRG